MEKHIPYKNSKLKKASATIFLTEKVHFKTKTVMRHKNGCFF